MEQATWNRARLNAVIQCPNEKQLPQEELLENIQLWYDLLNLNLSTDCDGYGNNFMADHVILFYHWIIVLVQHDDSTKE